MTEFLQALLAYPTALYTALLGVSLVYWGAVIVGAADFGSHGHGPDLDVDGGAHALGDGAVEGASHGVADAAGHGVADGLSHDVIDGAAHGVGDGAAHALSHGDAGHALDHGAAGDAPAHHGHDAEHLDVGGHEGALAHAIAALKLRSAPVTVVFSLFALFGWLVSVLGMRFLEPLSGGVFGTALFGTAVLALSVPVSLVATSFCVRPLAPLFVHATEHGHHALVGQSCLTMTGRVDDKFGQARLNAKGQDLLLQVRSRSGAPIARDTEVLIVEYDAAREVYWVEPMAGLLAEADRSTTKK